MASIRKRRWKNGKGEERESWAVNVQGGQGGRTRHHFRTKREADDFRVEVEGQLRTGSYRPDARTTTVQQAAELFREHCRGRMERRERMTRRNFETYEGYIRNYICPDPEWHARKHRKRSHEFKFFEKGIGGKTLAEVTVGIVTRFRDDLRAAGVSIPTTRKILAMLQVMFDHCISLDLLATNPATKVRVIGRRDEGAEKVIPPDKDVMRELVGLADENFRVQLVFAAATGLRAGELHALRWKHVSHNRRDVTVETRVDPYGDEDLPKTRAGLRTIPLGEGVFAALTAWRKRSRFRASDDLVFPNQLGGYANHDDMVHRKFLPLFKALDAKWKKEGREDVVTPFNWHALRHFAISCWIDAGLPPKTVQTFAGHSSLQVTMDIYGHLFRSEGHGRAMDAIADQVFSAESPQRPARSTRRGETGHDPT